MEVGRGIIWNVYTPVHPGKSFMRRIRSLEVGFSRLCRLVIGNRGNVVGKICRGGLEDEACWMENITGSKRQVEEGLLHLINTILILQH